MELHSINRQLSNASVWHAPQSTTSSKNVQSKRHSTPKSRSMSFKSRKPSTASRVSTRKGKLTRTPYTPTNRLSAKSMSRNRASSITSNHTIVQSNDLATKEIHHYKREINKLKLQCDTQATEIATLTNRIMHANERNKKLQTQCDEQHKLIHGLKSEILHSPDGNLLQKKIIEFDKKCKQYKSKYDTIKSEFAIVEKKLHESDCNLEHATFALKSIFKCFKKQYKSQSHHTPNFPSNHNFISAVNFAGTTTAYQTDREQTDNSALDQARINNVANNIDIELLVKENSTLHIDNKDLAFELMSEKQLNSKLQQSVNDLFLQCQKQLIKEEKLQVLKNFYDKKIKHANEQLTEMKKMFHHARFYYIQSMFDMNQLIEKLNNSVKEMTLENQNNVRKEQMKTTQATNELHNVIKTKEAQIQQFSVALTKKHQDFLTAQKQRDLVLEKLDAIILHTQNGQMQSILESQRQRQNSNKNVQSIHPSNQFY